MDPATLVLVFLIGALIGAFGVGGFLLVPVLVLLQGRPVRDAVVLAAASFAGSGLVALLARPWRGSAAGSYVPFLAAAAPGAIAGALLLRVVPARAVALAIALAVGLAGLGELFGAPPGLPRKTGALRSALQGVATGVGSALTGTSGPLIAMPLLAASGVPIVERIRLGQVAQLPIAACAALVFVVAGDIAWSAAAAAALVLALGTLAGMRVTTALAPGALSKASAALMLATAVSMLASAFLS